MLGLPSLSLPLLIGVGLVLLLQAVLLVVTVRQNRRRRSATTYLEADVRHNARPAKAGPEATEPGRLLHAVMNAIEPQVCILDDGGQILEVNHSWRRFLDGSPDPTLGEPGASYTRLCLSNTIYQGESANDLVDAVGLITAGELTEFAGEFVSFIAGEQRTLEVRLVPLVGSGQGAVVVLQADKTSQRNSEHLIRQEKRKAETLASALEASQASLELAMRGGELGLWHWDVSAGYFELSADWLERLGKAGGGGLNADIESFRDLIHEDELVFWTPDDAASLTPEEPYDRQFRLRWPDGQYRWVQVLGRTTSIDSHGVPESFSGVLIDINDRKTASLRDAGMAKIIEESLNEIYVADSETGRFIEVNRGARENLGYRLEQLREMTPADIHPEMTQEQVAETWRPLTERQADRVEFESIALRSDGTTYPLMLTMQAARLVDRDVVVAIGVDLTQRRRLETQLAQAQRLESIGQLAAGIAHEMNTPLQFIGNNIRFLSNCSDAIMEVLDSVEENLNPEGPALPWEERHNRVVETMERNHFGRVRTETPRAIADSLEGVERVLQIVRAMKEFSHPGEQVTGATDLNRSIQSTATVTRNHWKAVAELHLELDPNLPAVECQGGAINQVFVNLIVNAADAIAARRHGEPDAPEGRITVRSFLDGGQAVFEFEDNGCGMPEGVKQRVFDPFFTTKEVGQGTGQGLSLSHTIITKKHHGQIEIESYPGEGTVFRISLPLKSPAPNSSEAALVGPAG